MMIWKLEMVWECLELVFEGLSPSAALSSKNWRVPKLDAPSFWIIQVAPSLEIGVVATHLKEEVTEFAPSKVVTLHQKAENLELQV